MRADTPSATARLIAAATLLIDADPPGGVDVPAEAVRWCRLLLSGNWRDRLLVRSAAFGPTRALWRLIERATLPGIVAHYWHRKHHIEARCRNALAHGARRVVVLGAGLDTLAFRLALEFPEVAFIEVDHPATQGVKRAVSGVPPNVRFVACDLSADVLPDECIAASRATLLIAEGLLMYLPGEAVERHLAQWSRALSPGSRLIFTFMHRWPDGRSGFRPYSRWIDAWLAARREPFLWAIEPARIAGFVERAGLCMLECCGTRELSPRAIGSPLDGESVVVCELARQP